MIVARVCAFLAALVVCAWFVVGIRQARDTNAASALLAAGVRPAAAHATQIDSLLRSAKALNPDLNIDVLQARLTDALHQRPRALRMLEDVVRREPENLTAWSYRAVFDLGFDSQDAAVAARKIKELDPKGNFGRP